MGMFGGKYELRGDTGAGDCSLTLHTVDLRIDDGQWQCQVGIILMGDLYGTFDKEHSAGRNFNFNLMMFIQAQYRPHMVRIVH